MKKFVIIINGPICSGKTSISRKLWGKMKRTALLNLDKIKKLVYDYTPADLPLANKVGISMAKVYLENNVNVIIEKAFAKYEFVEQFVSLGSKEVVVKVYNIESPLNILEERLNTREKDKENGVTIERLHKSYKNYQEHKFKVDKTFDSSEMSSEEIAKEILKDIN
ncbi:AAA family ATPase [Bacteroidota bacterium]